MRAIDQRAQVAAFHKLRPFQYRHAPSLLERARADDYPRPAQRGVGWGERYSITDVNANACY